LPDTRSALVALRRSHERLSALVTPLRAEDLRGPSYASEWTIAQVLSHLGSGAEIGRVVLDAAVAGGPAPGMETYTAIWDLWNAKTPAAQVADALPADQALVAAYEALDDDQLKNVRAAIGPMNLDAAGVIRLRLAEHVAHTWDIAVALDPTATIDDAPMAELIDGLGMLAGLIGKPVDSPLHLHVHTTGPDRDFALDLTDVVSLSGWDGKPRQARLTLPAEALFRLVYGRLDPAHTPPIQADGVDVDSLRAAFPGF
jgi:uncharacterized protein (TIGR03083 family)